MGATLLHPLLRLLDDGIASLSPTGGGRAASPGWNGIGCVGWHFTVSAERVDALIFGPYACR